MKVLLYELGVVIFESRLDGKLEFVEFSIDGKYLACCTGDLIKKTKVHVWSTATWTPVCMSLSEYM